MEHLTLPLTDEKAAALGTKAFLQTLQHCMRNDGYY